MKMGDESATRTNKEGKEVKRSKIGQMMAGMGVGLGMFGLFLISSVGLFWLMGTPLVAAPVMLGAASLLLVSFALINMVRATKKIMDEVNALGGKKGVQDLTNNIYMLVSGVMDGVIRGVLGDKDANRKGLDTSGDGTISLKELREFKRIKRAVKMFAQIASSLSKFAKGLRAFAKLGEIASLEYEEDADGNMKPKLGGDKIHVVEIAEAVAGTFSLFIKTMIEKTKKLSKDQAEALKKFAKALTGKRGLIAGVSQFAEALKTYAEFGKAQKIYVTAYKEDGTIDETKKEGVPLEDVVKNIEKGFFDFVDKMVAMAPKIEDLNLNKMKRFNIALMGKKGFGGTEKPGLLDAVSEFSNTLALYAKYGEDNLIPLFNEKGEPIMDGAKQKTIGVDKVATNMVAGIGAFIGAFSTSADKDGLEGKAKDLKKKIENISDIINQFDKLAKSQEGMEKLASSMGLLATNVGLLVTNLGTLDTNKLQALATITAQHAVTTKGVPISETTKTPSSAPIAAPTDWNSVGEIIANKLAAKISGNRNGEFNFTFYDGATGGKLEINEK